MTTKQSALLIFLLFCFFNALAQDKSPAKFGKINPEDFSTAGLQVDTSSGAVIIADIGQSNFEGNSKGWFSLIYKHYRRVLIVNRNGIDLSKVEIALYISESSRQEETLEKLKASTYNLENGKVVETKLSDDAIFKEKYDKNHIIKKFTMPAVKAGSIIEYTYTIHSDFLFNLQPWSFQGSHPRVWSEYKVEIPNFFDYVFLAQGFHKFDISTKVNDNSEYQVRVPSTEAFSKDELYNLRSITTVNRWVIKNVPALKEEKYVSTLQNYISRIEFQKSAEQFPDMPRKEVMATWPKVRDDLFEDEQFGYSINRPNTWLDDDLKQICKGVSNDTEKAILIYKFVQSGIKSLGSRGIYLYKSIKDVFKSKSGYDQEINLLLTTMLRHENIEASPVLLSTVNNGYTNEMYPLLHKFNYVICMANINGVNYLLDASQPYLGFGKLPGYAYNGHARALNDFVTGIYISPDTLKESKLTSAILFNDSAKAGKWSGNCRNGYGYMESSRIRNIIIEQGKKGFENKIKDVFTGDYSVDHIEIDGLENVNEPLSVSEELTIETPGNPAIIYFNPMLHEGYKENPFKAAERLYPVEMPYCTDETFVLKLEIPQGYMVDEMPKSVRVSFNEKDGMFEYIIEKTGTDISLRSRIKFEKATFPPEEYESLRAFYDYIVKKHAEQIVFKRKS